MEQVIKKYQQWKDRDGTDIVEIIWISGDHINFRDINGVDYGTKAEMIKRDFLKKFKLYKDV